MPLPETHLFTANDPKLQLAIDAFRESIDELCGDDTNALTHEDRLDYKDIEPTVLAGFTNFRFSTPELQKVDGHGTTKGFVVLPSGQPNRLYKIATVEARIETPGIGIFGLEQVIYDVKRAIIMDPDPRPKNEGFHMFFQSVNTTEQRHEPHTDTQTTKIYEPINTVEMLKSRFDLLLGELAFYGTVDPNGSQQ